MPASGWVTRGGCEHCGEAPSAWPPLADLCDRSEPMSGRWPCRDLSATALWRLTVGDARHDLRAREGRSTSGIAARTRRPCLTAAGPHADGRTPAHRFRLTFWLPSRTWNPRLLSTSGSPALVEVILILVATCSGTSTNCYGAVRCPTAGRSSWRTDFPTDTSGSLQGRSP